MKPGLDDLGDAAIDDRAGVDDDARSPAASWPAPGLGAARMSPTASAATDQVPPLGDGQTQHPEAEEQRHAERQPVAERVGEGRQREAQQQAHQQPEQQADDGGHELGGGQVLDPRDEPHRGHDGQVRQDGEPDHDPGDDPGREQEPGVVGVA